jgi:hypothetical protein
VKSDVGGELYKWVVQYCPGRRALNIRFTTPFAIVARTVHCEGVIPPPTTAGYTPTLTNYMHRPYMSGLDLTSFCSSNTLLLKHIQNST